MLLSTAKQGATVPDPAQGPHATKRVFNYAFGEAGFSAHISQVRRGEGVFPAHAVFRAGPQ